MLMMVLPLPTTVSVCFTRISLLAGCWHGAGDGEAPSEQSAFVGASQVRTHQASPDPQKAHPCEICGLVLKDILGVALPQRTHPQLRPGTCGRRTSFTANLHQHGKQHRETPEKGFTCEELQVPRARGVLHLWGGRQGLPHRFRQAPAPGQS